MKNKDDNFFSQWETMVTKELEKFSDNFDAFVENLSEELENTIDFVAYHIDNYITPEIEEIVIEIFQPIEEIYEEWEESSGVDFINSLFFGRNSRDLSDFETRQDYEEDEDFQGYRNYGDDLLDNAFDLDFDFNPKVRPTSQLNPACIGCIHYHGRVYNGNLLVCAMHPHGWDSQDCPDWESEKTNLNW